jgi:hypothetical protein
MFSTLSRLLNRLSLRPRTPLRVAIRNRFMLRLETLEDRLCPAIDMWTGAGMAPTAANPNDDWSNPTNWSAGVPTANET